MPREALVVVPKNKGGEVRVSKAQSTAMLFLDGAEPVPEGGQSSAVGIESSVAADRPKQDQRRLFVCWHAWIACSVRTESTQRGICLSLDEVGQD